MPATLQDSLNYVSGYVQGMPLAAFTGSNPAVQVASQIRAFMLSAPFQWNFNRNSTTLTTVAGTQDYTVTVTDFGYLEQASVSDGTTIWQIKDIQNMIPMNSSMTQARPNLVAVQSQIIGTSIQVRLSAVPDAVYTVELIYQKAPILFTSTTDNWLPFPDGYGYIYNALFLGEMLADADDPRSASYRQRGIAALLSKAEGLSEQDKAVFASAYIQSGLGMQVPVLRSQQANQARSI